MKIFQFLTELMGKNAVWLWKSNFKCDFEQIRALLYYYFVFF